MIFIIGSNLKDSVQCLMLIFMFFIILQIYVLTKYLIGFCFPSTFITSSHEKSHTNVHWTAPNIYTPSVRLRSVWRQKFVCGFHHGCFKKNPAYFNSTQVEYTNFWFHAAVWATCDIRYNWVKCWSGAYARASVQM